MSKVVNFFDVIHLNEKISQQGLPAKVHLRDACGKQSLWIELLSAKNDNDHNSHDSGDDSELSQIKEQIIRFFATKGLSVEFDFTGGKNFWIV